MIYGFNDKKEKKDVIGYPDYANKLVEATVSIAYPEIRYVNYEFEYDGWAFFETENDVLLADPASNNPICRVYGTVAIPVKAGQTIMIMAPTEAVTLILKQFGMK